MSQLEYEKTYLAREIPEGLSNCELVEIVDIYLPKINGYEFLKIVLSQGEKTVFQPRGPKEFAQGEWKYICEWTGDIASFEGQEQILHKDEVVFRHSFSGGVLRG